MPYHRHPLCSGRSTAGPAARLGSETLVAGERCFAQAFGEMGF